jgi:DNA-binding GntR family transcriptional regulator
MAEVAKQINKDAIYKVVRRSIIMGHRKPGERLNIEELTTCFDTSVTPVRDALQMLNQEGLVTIKPRSGYFVTQMTYKELRDLLELRNILEISSLERAYTRITDEQIEELGKVHAGYSGDDDASYDRYTDENRHFHYLLAKASGNDELADTLGHLLDRLARYMVITGAGKNQEITHREIIEAIKVHDLKSARHALLVDINQTRDTVMDQVFQTEAEFWQLGI